MDRVLQTIGMVGAAIAIIVPLIAVFIGNRSDALIESRLTAYEEQIEQRITSIEEKLGISYAEPKLIITAYDGSELSGDVAVEVSIVKDWLQDERAPPTCSGSDFDQFGAEFSFILSNVGSGVGLINVFQLIHNGVFPDHPPTDASKKLFGYEIQSTELGKL